MKPLFSSRRYKLASIIRTGKKDTPGRLIFVGNPSPYGSEYEVTSPISGVVVESRYETNSFSRAHRLGPFVTVASKDGTHVRFSQLAMRIAKVGDYIVEGQVIGIAGANGVTVDCLRNSRLINALVYLDIPRDVWDFEPDEVSDEEKVVLACGVGTDMREYINRHPDAAYFWRGVARMLEGGAGV